MTDLLYISATTHDGLRRGDLVDVSGWTMVGLVAELRLGRLFAFDGTRMLRPHQWAVMCRDCATPFRSASDVRAHRVGGKCHSGEGYPAPAWSEVVYRLTAGQVAQVEAGTGCPLCGRDGSAEHMASMHPEARKPNGDGWRAIAAAPASEPTRESGRRASAPVGARQAAA